MSRRVKLHGGKADGRVITIEGDDFLPITYGARFPYTADDGLREEEVYINTGDIDAQGFEIWRQRQASNTASNSAE